METIIENVNSSLVCRDSKTGNHSWRALNRKAFSELAENEGLKGRALKKAHWDYLQRTSSELGAAAASEIAAQRIVITGVSANAKGTGGTLKWETSDHFARHAATERVVKAMTQQDALNLLAKSLGMDVSAIVAKLAK